MENSYQGGQQSRIPPASSTAGAGNLNESTRAASGYQGYSSAAKCVSRRVALADDKPVFLKLELAGSGFTEWKWSKPKETKPFEVNNVEGQIVSWRNYEDEDEGNNPIYTFAGPTTAGGTLDTGSNSTANNILTAGILIDQFVTKTTESGKGPIVILIKGHSRNAVASTFIANNAKTNNDITSVELVAFDPVPGPGQNDQYCKTTVEDIDESTVVYCLDTGYKFGFVPQIVFGAKRVIVSRKDHLVGLNVGVIWDDMKYKGSSLNSLPPGFYVVDEKTEQEEKLRQCNNADEVKEYLTKVKTNSREGAARVKIITDVAESFGWPPKTRTQPTVADDRKDNDSVNATPLMVKKPIPIQLPVIKEPPPKAGDGQEGDFFAQWMPKPQPKPKAILNQPPAVKKPTFPKPPGPADQDDDFFNPSNWKDF